MKKIFAVFFAVAILISSVSVSAFALDKNTANAEREAQYEAFKNIVADRIDVNGTGTIDAGDAREVLLFSAGLKNDNVNTDNVDIDGDGSVTAIDARIYLRLAAGLESVSEYFTDAEKYAYFLAIINSIKPNEYNYYESVLETTDSVAYKDNSNVVSEMNRQLGIYARYDDTMEDFDFGEEIKAAEDDKSARYSTASSAKKTESNYPVKDNELAFLAGLDEIERIEYKTNQTFTYTRYSPAFTSVRYTDSVSGLDSFTVYLKPDSELNISGDVSGMFDDLIAGQAHDILSEKDIEDLLDQNASISSIDGMKDYGKCEISITPRTLKYHGCYVTVYFYPETGIPVGTVHNLHYNIKMNMAMDIDLSPEGMLGDNSNLVIELLMKALTAENKGKLLYVKGNLDITNEMSTCTTVYFYKNNPNHVTYNDYINNNKS